MDELKGRLDELEKTVTQLTLDVLGSSFVIKAMAAEMERRGVMDHDEILGHIGTHLVHGDVTPETRTAVMFAAARLLNIRGEETTLRAPTLRIVENVPSRTS